MTEEYTEDQLWIEVSSEHRHAAPRVWCLICQRIEKARNNLTYPDHFRPGRFVLLQRVGAEWSYATSWDTWEEAEVCFEDGRIPAHTKLVDDHTGREWWPGSPYEWEAART